MNRVLPAESGSLPVESHIVSAPLERVTVDEILNPEAPPSAVLLTSEFMLAAAGLAAETKGLRGLLDEGFNLKDFSLAVGGGIYAGLFTAQVLHGVKRFASFNRRHKL